MSKKNGRPTKEICRISNQRMIGPMPIHEVVVIAVRKAVSAATTTFTAISTKRFFIRYSFLLINFVD